MWKVIYRLAEERNGWVGGQNVEKRRRGHEGETEQREH